jgi:hypothetical protein
MWLTTAQLLVILSLSKGKTDLNPIEQCALRNTLSY